MMLAGSIATITAFVVVNFTFDPAFILWLAPTVVITPIILIWNIKIVRGTVEIFPHENPWVYIGVPKDYTEMVIAQPPFSGNPSY